MNYLCNYEEIDNFIAQDKNSRSPGMNGIIPEHIDDGKECRRHRAVLFYPGKFGVNKI